MAEAVALVVVCIAALTAQSMWAGARNAVMVVGAILALGLAPQGSFVEILRFIPYNVILIVFAFQSVSRLLTATNVFEYFAVRVLRSTKDNSRITLFVLCLLMFLVSATVNNLAAMILLLPVVFSVLHRMRPRQKYSLRLLAILLPLCNLGGVATPIGDFPALLMWGTERIEFWNYLMHAVIPASLAASILTIWAVATTEEKEEEEEGEEETTATIELPEWGAAENLGTAVLIVVASAVFLSSFFHGPLVIFILGFATTVIAFAGAMYLALGNFSEFTSRIRQKYGLKYKKRKRGRYAVLFILDFGLVWFFLCLFVMVGAIEQCGLVSRLADAILHLNAPVLVQLMVLVFCSSVISGFFSATPGMALALPVADAIIKAHDLPSIVVYTAVAMGICAGSSLFLFSATSGPVLQRNTEAANLTSRHEKPVVISLSTYFQHGGFMGWLITLIFGMMFCVYAAAQQG